LGHEAGPPDCPDPGTRCPDPSSRTTGRTPNTSKWRVPAVGTFRADGGGVPIRAGQPRGTPTPMHSQLEYLGDGRFRLTIPFRNGRELVRCGNLDKLMDLRERVEKLLAAWALMRSRRTTMPMPRPTKPAIPSVVRARISYAAANDSEKPGEGEQGA
jgi:hypothetical protein